MRIVIGKYIIHNQEQFDLNVFPILCVHKKYKEEKSVRVFIVFIKDKKLFIRRNY